MKTYGVGKGIAEDIRGRIPWYSHDWVDGWSYGIRLLAPATYIFFASVIPALAFGQQLFIETDGQLSGVQVLIATAITGTVQALLGGQPLLIIGVAEPIVLIYSFMFSFAQGQSQLGSQLFLPWAAWVCIWAAVMILVMSCVNICNYVSRFTRLSGELFGFLIAVLFMQQAIKGSRLEFLPQEGSNAPEGAAREYAWDLVNGFWSLFLAFGLTLTALLTRTAHKWQFGSVLVRQLIADYGAPLMVIAWSALSYALHGAPNGVPRRVDIPDTWNDTGPWSVARDIGKVPGVYIGAALLPAAVIALLFFFDHSVSAQLAQQPEFNLRKPPAYHYDFFLLGLMTLGCGLIGIPPVNGVLPQAPMHTKSLATLRQGHVRRQLGKVAKEAGRRGNAANGRHAASCSAATVDPHAKIGVPPDLAGHTATGVNGQAVNAADSGGAHAVIMAMAAKSRALGSSAADLLQTEADARCNSGMEAGENSAKRDFNFERDIDTYIPVEVTETRITGLLQSLLVACCLGLTMAIRLIPSAVLWGYFAFMALESLAGSQFWERLLYLATDPAKRYRLLEQGHAPYVETVPFRAVAAFTLFQLVYLLVVYGITWIPIAGFLFPLPIIALIPIRTYLLPKMFSGNTLRELDASAYEEAPPLSHEEALAQMERRSSAAPGAAEEEEVIDEEVTHGRTFQIRHHVSRRSIQQRRSASLGCKPPDESPCNPAGTGDDAASGGLTSDANGQSVPGRAQVDSTAAEKREH